MSDDQLKAEAAEIMRGLMKVIIEMALLLRDQNAPPPKPEMKARFDAHLARASAFIDMAEISKSETSLTHGA